MRICWPNGARSLEIGPGNATLTSLPMPSRYSAIDFLPPTKTVVLKFSGLCLGPRTAVAEPEPSLEPFGHWATGPPEARIWLMRLAVQVLKPAPDSRIFCGMCRMIVETVLRLSGFTVKASRSLPFLGFFLEPPLAGN